MPGLVFVPFDAVLADIREVSAPDCLAEAKAVISASQSSDPSRLAGVGCGMQIDGAWIEVKGVRDGD